MTIGQWLSFRGRIGRRTFWLGYIVPLFLASLVASILDAALGLAPAGDAMAADASQIGVLSGLVSLLSIWPSLAGSIKRLHDRDRSGWWIGAFYLFAIAIGAAGLMSAMTMHYGGAGGAGAIVLIGTILLIGFGIWLIVETGFLRGTDGPNRYGPDPLGGQGAPQWQPGGAPQPGWDRQGWQPPPQQGWPPSGQGQGGPPPGQWGGPGRGGSVPPVRRD